MILNSELIKARAKLYGADLCGIAPISRFDGTPIQRDPKSILPKAKSVIGFGFRVPKGLYDCMDKGTQYNNYVSLGVKYIDEEFAEIFLLKMAGLIENEGYDACVQRNVSNLKIKGDKSQNPELIDTYELQLARPVAPGKATPDVIMDFAQAAEACGIGCISKKGNVICKEFGPYVRYVFLVTDLELEPDPVYAENLCDSCGACVDACPGKAVSLENGTDTWQCSVYYRGAHESNPYMNENVLKDHPDREAILKGEYRFDAESARAVYPELNFMPSRATGYAPCLCGKKCDVVCYEHIMSKQAKPAADPAELRQQIIDAAMKNGADYVGFGPISRFVDQPVSKIFDKTKTVICLGFRVLRGSYRGVEEGTTYYQYSTTGVETIEETVMPMALLKTSAVLEDGGFTAVPQKQNQLIMSSTGDTNPEMAYEEIFRGLNKETQMNYLASAVLCGIGERGLNGTVLTDENGPFQRFGFILTDAELEETPLVTPHLCDGCKECVNACPGKALSDDGKRDNWQCAAYYNGANMSKNPFMPPEAYDDLPNREAIMKGEAKLDVEEAKEVLDRSFYYPPIKHGYVSSICGRACDRACYVHLEEKGMLKNAFTTKFRKREDWKLSVDIK